MCGCYRTPAYCVIIVMVRKVQLRFMAHQGSAVGRGWRSVTSPRSLILYLPLSGLTPWPWRFSSLLSGWWGRWMREGCGAVKQLTVQGFDKAVGSVSWWCFIRRDDLRPLFFLFEHSHGQTYMWACVQMKRSVRVNVHTDMLSELVERVLSCSSSSRLVSVPRGQQRYTLSNCSSLSPATVLPSCWIMTLLIC